MPNMDCSQFLPFSRLLHPILQFHCLWMYSREFPTCLGGFSIVGVTTHCSIFATSKLVSPTLSSKALVLECATSLAEEHYILNVVALGSGWRNQRNPAWKNDLTAVSENLALFSLSKVSQRLRMWVANLASRSFIICRRPKCSYFDHWLESWRAGKHCVPFVHMVDQFTWLNRTEEQALVRNWYLTRGKRRNSQKPHKPCFQFMMRARRLRSHNANLCQNSKF